MGGLQDRITREAFSFMDGGKDANKNRLEKIFLAYDKELKDTKDTAFKQLSAQVMKNDALGEYLAS